MGNQPIKKFNDRLLSVCIWKNEGTTNFRKDCIGYRRLIKHKKSGKLIWKCKEKVLRNPSYEDIDTNVIENYNGILREKISRW